MRIRIYNPMMRLKSNWRLLGEAELRLLMYGLADWERRSVIGPTRSRIRRRRREAVRHYRAHVGSLGDDRLWVAERLPVDRRDVRSDRHDPRKENQFGVLWHEA
jgi:hypothetical protein